MTDSPTPHQRIHELDGLRAFSICAVVLMHLELTGLCRVGMPEYLGRQGVTLFFVLSGYLITRILLRRPQLGNFYWRRFWRICPTYYIYLLTVALVCFLGLYQIRPLAWLAAATYWINFLPGEREWPLQHTWSLAIEEQFYLAWPLALRLLGPARAGLASFLCLAGWPLQRYLRTGHWGHPTSYEAVFSSTYDALLYGVLAALVTRQLKATGHLKTPVRVGLIACMAGLTAVLVMPEQLPSLLIPWLRGAGMASLILWVVHHPGHPSTAWLGKNPLRWLGTRSYSIYLWHPLFCDTRLLLRVGWPAAVGLILVTSELSYRLVELGSSRIRQRLEDGHEHRRAKDRSEIR